jgi:GT2 family glycosyltransferase
MVDVSEKKPAVGACQPKLKSLLAPDYFEYNGACGGMLDVYGTPLCRGRIFDLSEEDRGQYDTTTEVFWASGAAMFLRTKAIRETGLLDEMLYAHMEEIDLSWRMRLLGYQVLCVPDSVVYHIGGRTWAKRPIWEQLYLKHRNNLIVMLKNYSTYNVIRFLTIRLFLDAGFLIYSLVKKEQERILCVLRAYFWILQNFRQILAARRNIQKQRRVPDSKIVSAMVKKSVAIQYYLLHRKFFSELSSLPYGLDNFMRMREKVPKKNRK